MMDDHTSGEHNRGTVELRMRQILTTCETKKARTLTLNPSSLLTGILLWEAHHAAGEVVQVEDVQRSLTSRIDRVKYDLFETKNLRI